MRAEVCHTARLSCSVTAIGAELTVTLLLVLPGGDRKLSIDDAWRHAGNVFDDSGAACGDNLLDVDDEVMEVAPRAHGKELATLSRRHKPPKPSGPRVMKPPPAPKPPGPPLPPFDEAAYGGLTHVTRSRTAAITGYNMRRRRGEDDDSEDGTGRTTRSSTRANGFVGAYSPEARRKRIQKCVVLQLCGVFGC
jgi:hypothetical protein